MTSFIDDVEKMNDFNKLTKEEFLKEYSYLTGSEYELTKILDDIITDGIYEAMDNGTNAAGVYVGGYFYEEYTKYIKQDIDITAFVDMLINELEKDDRVNYIAGVLYNDVIDIIFTDKTINNRLGVH